MHSWSTTAMTFRYDPTRAGKDLSPPRGSGAMNAAAADFLDEIPVTSQDVEDEELRQDLSEDPQYMVYLGLYDEHGDPEEGRAA